MIECDRLPAFDEPWEYSINFRDWPTMVGPMGYIFTPPDGSGWGSILSETTEEGEALLVVITRLRNKGLAADYQWELVDVSPDDRRVFLQLRDKIFDEVEESLR